MNHREFEIRDRVVFDHRNVIETANHCWARNGYLQGKAASVEAAAEKLIAEVLKHVGTEAPGTMFPIFQAWCVLDPISPGSVGKVGDQEISQADWQANLFVRLGRQPVLRTVGGGATSFP